MLGLEGREQGKETGMTKESACRQRSKCVQATPAGRKLVSWRWRTKRNLLQRKTSQEASNYSESYDGLRWLRVVS